jgi:putative ABC transport system permease protein
MITHSDALLPTDPPAPVGTHVSAFRNRHALAECVRSAFISVRAYALRSTLTTLGIVIGVAAVICAVGLMQGLTHSVSRQFSGLGGNALTVRSYTPVEDQLRGKFNRLRPTDLEHLRYRVDGISHITPVVFAGQRMAEVRYGTRVTAGQVFGTSADYQDAQQSYPIRGRFLTHSDDSSSRRVAVIGERMRLDLDLPENPLGAFIQVGREWFKVVGLMEPRGEVFGASQDNYMLVPYQTAIEMSGVLVEPDLWITFTVDDLAALQTTRERIRALIRRLHAIGPDEPDDFIVETADTLAKSFDEISTVITLVVAGIVGISLLVGGVGIMNMMLVSVTERTREIGIAKALGASRQFVLAQFLAEATLLALAGGVIGVVIGLGLSKLIAGLIPNFPEAVVPAWAVLGTVGFCTLIGLVFGMTPASRAADMPVIDALRYE